MSLGNAGELAGLRVSFTDHAVARLLEMKVSALEVRLCLTEPDDVVDSRKYPGTTNYRRGDLNLGVEAKNGCLRVITALFATNQAWQEAARKGRLGADRKLRVNPGLPK